MATVTIVKRPRKKKGSSYIVQYVDPETKQKRYRGSFDRKGDALKEKARLEVAIDGGQHVEKQRASRSMRGKTVGHFCDLCEQEWQRREQEGSLRPATAAGYLGRLKLIRSVFGSRLIGTITEESILNFRAKEAHRNSPASANRYLFVIQQVMKRAVKEKAITTDPSAAISKLSEKQHERKEFLKPQEVDRLLAHAAREKTRHYMVLAILLAVEHGCSRQEILDLKWTDIDLDFGNTGSIRFFRTKNKQERLQLIMPRTRRPCWNEKRTWR